MAGGTLLPYQKHDGGRTNFDVVPETRGWQGSPYCHVRNRGRLCCFTRNKIRPGKAPPPYQDGRRDLTAMPEHKRKRGDFTVLPGTLG